MPARSLYLLEVHFDPTVKSPPHGNMGDGGGEGGDEGGCKGGGGEGGGGEGGGGEGEGTTHWQA